MAIQYTNRKDDIYYLQAGKTKTGKPRYWCGQKLTGEPLEAVPQGYEIREDPLHAIVTLRKVRPTKISPLEIKLLSNGIRQYAGLEHFIVDVEGDSLVVYLPDRAEDQADEMLEEVWRAGVAHVAPRAGDQRVADAALQLHEDDAVPAGGRGQTHVRRPAWCFRGSVNDWIGLGSRTPAPLPALVRTYVQDLGKESFYDLM